MSAPAMISRRAIRISPRRELRFALLAGMESCWVYALLALVGTSMHLRLISPMGVFAAFWIGLVAGRLLPRGKSRWVFLQAAAVLIAALTTLSVARFELYPEFALYDFGWLPRYLSTLFAFTAGVSIEHLAALGVLFAFVRGLGFAQRPLTLWFTGFEFRLGIIIFFVLLLLASLGRRYDPTPWLFVYFFVSLLAIALARMEEMESGVSFGPRWAGILVISVLFVIGLGFLLLHFLTLDVVTGLLRLFAPVWSAAVAIVVLLTLPVAIVVGWLVDLLRPYFSTFESVFRTLGQLFPAAAASRSASSHAASSLAFLVPYLKPLLALAALLIAGAWVAGALSRRIKQSEAEAFYRESLGEERYSDRDAPAKKAKPSRRGLPHASAESIRRIYAALVARAGHAGLPRAIAETPYEYLPRLVEAWPAHAADFRAITEAYVDVHYGEREFAASDVSRLKAVWEKLEQSIG